MEKPSAVIGGFSTPTPNGANSIFPFGASEPLAAMEKSGLIVSCQPEGRFSRRKYYRISQAAVSNLTLERYHAAKLASSSCQNGTLVTTKRHLPITDTTTNTTSKRNKGASDETPCPLRKYPRSEEEMYAALEELGVEQNPDYDGDFFNSLQRNGWKVKGKPVFDWVTLYEARVAHIVPGGG